MIEEFKDIKNYEDVYQITSYGRIYNKILKKFRMVYTSRECKSCKRKWSMEDKSIFSVSNTYK